MIKPVHHYLNNCDSAYQRDKRKWMLLLFLYSNLFQSNSAANCPTEYSLVQNSELRFKWESSKSVHHQVVIADPPCLQDNGKLITRICSDGIWYPSQVPECQRVSYTKSGKCPEILQNVNGYCVYVTDPQTWQQKFELRNQKRGHLSEEKLLWLPIQRTVKYGPFEYRDIGNDFGNSLNLNVTSLQDFFAGDCVSYNTDTEEIQVEKCINVHPIVKRIPYFHNLYNCPENCQPAGLIAKKCYCKEKNRSCHTWAAVNDSLSKFQLEAVAGDEVCEIGDKFPTTLSSKGFRLYLNGSVLRYANDLEVDCSICERKPLKTTESRIVLSFEEKKRRLYLLMYYPEGILRNNENKYEVYCFTNAAQQLKKKLKLERVSKYRYRENKISLIVYKVKIEKYMGEYWCDAFTLNTSIISSNKIIAFEKRKGNEYALRIIIKNLCKAYGCDYENFYDHIIDGKLEDIFRPFNAKLRIMEIFHVDVEGDSLDILLHVSTDRKLNVTQEYGLCLSRLEKARGLMEVIYFKSAEFCLTETTNFGDVNLTWPLIKVGIASISDEFCLADGGVPAIRKCQGDFLHGATWGNIQGHCASNSSISDLTIILKQSLQVNSAVFPIENIWTNLEGNVDLGLLDLYYLTKVMRKISQDRTKPNMYLFAIIDKFLDINSSVLKKSQNLLSLTDSILYLVNSILSQSTFNNDTVFLVQKHNIIVHITNPFLSNISGLALYGDDNSSFMNSTVKDIYCNDSLGNIDTDNLQLAFYVPELVLEQILNETSVQNISEILVISLIFLNDSLFIDNNFQSSSYVVSVSIPGFGSYLDSPLPILFRSNQTEIFGCAFWNYEQSTNVKPGRWSSLGGNYLGNFTADTLHLCSFVHLTNFALLLMSDPKTIADENAIEFLLDSDDYNEHILNIITIIGGTISVIGIIGIFLTAILFEHWRQKVGTKILINLSLAILLETICIHLSEIKSLKESEQSCKIIGMLLHYVVLSKFFWMLIYAFLQYLRFVKVIATIPNNLMLKSAIIGWGLPLFLVSIVGLATTESYISNSYEICYPRGTLLYMTVLLPIGVIVAANLTIFCMIMYQVTHSKVKSYANSRPFKLQFYLAILLFFVLGLPWLFGILAEIMHFSTLKIILFYLFCITATLQGFILFLFYVILNKETKDAWTRYIKYKTIF